MNFDLLTSIFFFSSDFSFYWHAKCNVAPVDRAKIFPNLKTFKRSGGSK